MQINAADAAAVFDNNDTADISAAKAKPAGMAEGARWWTLTERTLNAIVHAGTHARTLAYLHTLGRAHMCNTQRT